MGDSLYICLDRQNTKDKDAVLLRTQDPIAFVGYVPRFLARDFWSLVEENSDEAKVNVVKINKDAPEQLRLLCEFDAHWPEDFKPFDHESFEYLA